MSDCVQKNGFDQLYDLYSEKISYKFWKDWTASEDKEEICKIWLDLFCNVFRNNTPESKQSIEIFRESISLPYWDLDLFIESINLKSEAIPSQVNSKSVTSVIYAFVKAILDFIPLINEVHEKLVQFRLMANEKEDEEHFDSRLKDVAKFYNENPYRVATLKKLESERKLASESSYITLVETLSDIMKKLTASDKGLFLATEQNEFSRLFKSGEEHSNWAYIQTRTDMPLEEIKLLYSVYPDAVQSKENNFTFDNDKNRAYGKMLGIKKYLNLLISKRSQASAPANELPYFKLKNRNSELIADIYELLIKYNLISRSKESHNALTAFFSKSETIKKMVWRHNIGTLKKFINVLKIFSEVSDNNKWTITALYFLNQDGKPITSTSLSKSGPSKPMVNGLEFESELKKLLNRYS